MANEFSKTEWKKIRATLNADPQRYGLPSREYGSVVLASANVRKLGARENRDSDTWQFFADVFRHFDLLAVQEVLEDMTGLRHLKSLMGDEFGLVVSDTTGAFPDEDGLAERMAFIFNWKMVNRKEMVTDISYDRSKVVEIISDNIGDIATAVENARTKKSYLKKVKAYEKKLRKFELQGGRKPKEPALEIKMPVFVSFIRTPFGVMFETYGHPGAQKYSFLAINAHLYFGDYISDRVQEFDALLAWIMGRVQEGDVDESVDVVLLGDLNMNFDNPANDRKDVVAKIKELNAKLGKHVNVYFPFLNPHPRRNNQQIMGSDGKVLKTNARLSETYDQIGFFSRDDWVKNFSNKDAGKHRRGPNFGVFDFVNLFSDALHGMSYAGLSTTRQEKLVSRFEHDVSDHMPLWFRLPLHDETDTEYLKAPIESG